MNSLETSYFNCVKKDNESKLDKSFKSALNLCKAKKLKPLFNRQDWLGNTREENGKKIENLYPVHCLICDSDYQTWFHGTRVKSCPYCHNGTSKVQSWFSIKNELLKRGFTLLTTKEQWQGITITSGNRANYEIKCNTCGFIFHNYLRKDKGLECPICSSRNSLKDGYEVACKHLISSNLTPLFSKKEYQGIKKADGIVFYYPVQCKTCQTKFETFLSFKSGQVNVMKCPTCHNAKVGSRNQYIRLLSRFRRDNVTPLFSKEDYQGVFHNGHFIKYPLKCNKCGTKFEAILNGENVTGCPVCTKSSGRSKLELYLESELNHYDLEVWYNTRRVLQDPTGHPLELDIYFPKLKLAFEVNGSFYHSKDKCNSTYHLFKTEACLSKGILLYHLWDNWSKQKMLSFIKQVLFSSYNSLIPAAVISYSPLQVSRDLCPVTPLGYKLISTLEPQLTNINGYQCWNTGGLVLIKVNNY